MSFARKLKIAKQLNPWEESETNRVPGTRNRKKKKIQFSAGCVFLDACAAGDKEDVLRLLQKGTDIDTSNLDGLTALHQACINDNLDMVEFLVEHGADVNRGDNEGWTPLHATASSGFISIAKYLIENGGNVAAVNNDAELPVDIAKSDEMKEMLQQNIEAKGIDCDEARNEEERMMLEDAKAWLNSGLFEDEPHPKTGARALHVAAAKGYIKVMRLLLQGGADVNVQDFDGWTPLHAAAHWGQKEACEMLVENFCDMEMKNYVGQTSFDIADPDMIPVLEDLQKRQAAMQRDHAANNAILQKKGTNNSRRRSSITRMSVADKSNLIKKDASSERQLLDQSISEEDSTNKMLKVKVEIEPVSNKEDTSEQSDVSEVGACRFYPKYLELKARINAGSCPTLHSPSVSALPTRSASLRDKCDPSSMTGARTHLLKEIEERLSKCTVDKNQISAAHMFISDCIRNISDDNILTESDLGQWEILNAEKTSGVTCEETPVYLCNDTAVIEMEIKLMEEERDEKFLEVYEEVEWYLSEELKELNAILNQLEEKTLESQKSYVLALNKYEEDSENVFVANLRVIDDLKNFDETVMKGQYLCESPLTTLKEKFDCFLESFNFHLTKHFLEAAKINGGERCRNITAEQRIMEESISGLQYENYILECLLKGQEAALSHIMAMTDSNGKGVTSSLKTSIHDEVATLKNTETVQDIILGFKNDLISLSHLSANVKKLKHILTMCNSKYNRVNYWLLQTEKWTNCIKEENKLITDVLHVLNFEKEEASKVLCFFKDLETCLKREHDAAVCRTAFIQTQLQNPIENSILQSVLVNILGQFSIDKSISTKLLWKQLEEALIPIKKSNVWKQNNFLRSLKDQRCILFENEYLFKLISGLRKEPVLNYSQILLNIPTYLQKLDDSEKALCAINQDFIEKQNTLSSNYFMKHRRLLWVYILCDEDKLTEVLSHANECLNCYTKSKILNVI